MPWKVKSVAIEFEAKQYFWFDPITPHTFKHNIELFRTQFKMITIVMYNKFSYCDSWDNLDYCCVEIKVVMFILP